MSVHFYQHTSRYTGRDISITATYLGGLGLKSVDRTSLGKFSSCIPQTLLSKARARLLPFISSPNNISFSIQQSEPLTA